MPWKVYCEGCGTRYDQTTVQKPEICGNCGSDDILVGTGPKPKFCTYEDCDQEPVPGLDLCQGHLAQLAGEEVSGSHA